MKVTLHCEDVSTHLARDPQEAKMFRQQIHNKVIDIDYMPNVNEKLILHTYSGWVTVEVGARGIDCNLDDGTTTYGIWISKIVIMGHNE